MTKKKQAGQVFTPPYLVCDILNVANYDSCEILNKHVIDNSCGDGAFLCEIVRRYCKSYNREVKDIKFLKEHLETYIHGVELDPIAFSKCLRNLNEIVAEYGLSDIKWDISNDNALKTNKYDNQMDFVIGNPPYVRVHNLEDNYDDVKQFKFADNGMTDLYLVFFELGFKMLKKGGRLCYITPSSWLNSVAGGNLRNYIKYEHNLVELVDLEHFQPFNATTYTIISLFQKGTKHNKFKYARYDEKEKNIQHIDDLRTDDVFIGKYMYLTRSEHLATIKEMHDTYSYQYVTVKNGFATLNDKIFISKNFPFDSLTIPTIKASTGVWYKAFFPYEKNGKPLSKEVIFKDERIANYLETHKTTLSKEGENSDSNEWYLFGRTQALKDVYSNKYAINTVIKDKNSIKLNKVPEGSGVYSGLYILTDIDDSLLREIIVNDQFIDYVKTLKKYKSGGYYTFNSKDLEKYINFKLSKEYGQSRISIDSKGLF